MQDKSLDLTEIVKVTQLPKIYSQLEIIGKYIDKNLEGLDDLECTEENKQKVKNRRSEINKTLDVLENKRKEIKKAIEEPYNQFVEKYDTECKNKLKNASASLTEKINQIEDKQRAFKRTTLESFFKQYQEYYHLENLVNFGDLGLNITITASEKQLKEQIVNTLMRIASEVNLINQDENREQLLYEYKASNFDYVKAKTNLAERLNTANKLFKDSNRSQEKIESENAVVQNVETLISPPKEIKEEKHFDFTLHFKNVTQKKVELMKAFFESEDIEYSD